MARFFPVLLLVATVMAAALLQQAHSRDVRLMEQSSLSSPAALHVEIVVGDKDSSRSSEIVVAANVGACHYHLLVKTADISGAGTDSSLSFLMFNKEGERISFTVDGTGRPFERDTKTRLDLDTSCIHPCRLIVKTDGTGDGPGWLCEYVEITVSGGVSDYSKFDVNEWIGPKEASMQFVRNKC